MLRISVIIPSANREQAVQDLLSDLGNQEWSPDEIVVVDQSSEPYDLPECVYIRDRGRGPCRARNLGVAAATGDILVFLDDDIRIEPEFLRHLCEPIALRRYDAVTGAMCDADGVYFRPVGQRAWIGKDSGSWVKDMTALPDHPGTHVSLAFTTACAAVRASVLREVGLFDLFFDPDGAGEDREMGLRLFHAGYPVLFNGLARLKHLALESGGRRSPSPGYGRLNVLDAHMLYIVGRYFGRAVFERQCEEWLRSNWRAELRGHPATWGRAYLRWKEAKGHVRRVREALARPRNTSVSSPTGARPVDVVAV